MKKLSQKILLFCVALTLLFIWVNSMLPADLSGEESEWVKKLLQPVLDFLHSGRIQVRVTALIQHLPPRLGALAERLLDWLERHVLSKDATVLVRKAAHFSEYLLLGFLTGLLFVRRDGRSRFFLPEAACLVAAVIDEGIQLFSAGRAAQVRDVCIDMSGATTGLVVALVLLSVLRLFHREEKPKFGKDP